MSWELLEPHWGEYILYCKSDHTFIYVFKFDVLGIVTNTIYSILQFLFNIIT